MATTVAIPVRSCELHPDQWEFDRPLEACPLCDHPTLRPHDHDYLGRRVDRCGNCGLMFMNPQYSDAYLARYYARYYHDGQDRRGLRVPDISVATRQATAKRERLRRLNRHAPAGRLLCLGCGNGLELLLARQLGWQPEGHDVDENYVRQLREQLDMPLHCGNLTQLQLPAESYDAVFMDQVLEHPKRPQDYLREIHRLLRPGGLLLIACPNLGSLSNRVKTALGRWGWKRHRGKHYDLFHHLFLYEPQPLARALRRYYGYEVVEVRGDAAGGRRRRKWSACDPLRRRFPLLESSFCLIVRKPLI